MAAKYVTDYLPVCGVFFQLLIEALLIESIILLKLFPLWTQNISLAETDNIYLQSTNMMDQLLFPHTNVHKILGTLKPWITVITDYASLCQLLLMLL